MAMKYPVMWALGLMSGTSLDGVDAALVKTDGVHIFEKGPHMTVPFEEDLFKALHDAVHLRGDIAKTQRDMTKMHGEVVKRLLREANMDRRQIGVIGFHGQTISHRPKEGITWQIGDGALLAGLTDIDVVCDFRSRDVAAGGEGAPLVPLYHAALAGGMSLPVAVLNIGGIANVTWIGKSEAAGEGIMSYDILAFDTGPGNVMLNEWVRKHIGKAFDEGGELARKGRVFENIVDDFMAHDYFKKEPPKSLDRNDFNINELNNLSVEDGAATLTEFMVRSVKDAVTHFPAPPKTWLVTGGGRHNYAIMKGLSELLPGVAPVETVGWEGDALEAQAFAFLAVRSLYNLPLSLPTTTGTSFAVTGGAHYRAGYYNVR